MAHIAKTPPGWSGPERAELAWSQPLQLAPARPGSFSAKSAWSQRFPTGVSCSSWSQRGVRRLGLESAVFVGVSVESAVPGWSQRGVRCFGLESAWSQAFPAGVSVGPARSQLLVARGPWGHGRCLLYTPAPPPPPPPPRAATAHRQTTPHPPTHRDENNAILVKLKGSKEILIHPPALSLPGCPASVFGDAAATTNPRWLAFDPFQLHRTHSSL